MVVSTSGSAAAIFPTKFLNPQKGGGLSATEYISDQICSGIMYETRQGRIIPFLRGYLQELTITDAKVIESGREEVDWLS